MYNCGPQVLHDVILNFSAVLKFNRFISPYKHEGFVSVITFSDVVPSSQKTHCVFITKVIVTTYGTYTHAVWAECRFLGVITGGAYANHWALRDYKQNYALL